MSTPLAVGQLLLGTADLPGVSSIASAVAESAAQDKIPWSALEYSGQTITSISGSAIGGQGGGDTSQCFPATASALLQPSGNYLSATDSGNFYPMTGNPSSFVQSGELSAYAKESSVSGKLDASASSLFAPSGDYAFNSSLNEYVSNSSFTSYTSNIDSSITNMSSVVSGLTGTYLEQSASSLFAPSGDYAYNSALSGYIPTSASSSFMPSGDYQTAGDYAYNSAVSSKLDASASSEFYLASNPSGFITGVDQSALSSMIPYSALDYNAGTQDITGISGSAFSVSGMTLIFDSSMNQTFSGNSSTVGVDVGSFIRAVGDASAATAANILYIVTGSIIV